MPSRTRRATVTPAEPGATSTNSSPPVRRDRVDEPHRLARGRAATWRRTWSPARAPAASLSAVKPSTSNRATETSAALALRAGDLELEHAAERARVGQAGQRVGVGDALEPLGALGGHRRGAERRDRRGGEVGDGDQQRLLGRVDVVLAVPAERQHADARLDAAARDDERQVRARHRAARPRPPSVRPSEPVRSSAAWWIGWSGLSATVRLEGGALLVGHPEREQQLEACRSGSLLNSAAIAAPAAAAPASTITAERRPGRSPGRAPRRPPRGR